MVIRSSNWQALRRTSGHLAAGTPSKPGPFARPSFLKPWWSHLAPLWLDQTYCQGVGQAGIYLAAGSGAADFAQMSPETIQAALPDVLKSGLVLPRVAEGTPLADWCDAEGTVTIDYDVAPRMALTGGWEAVRQRRSSRTWSGLRRKARRMASQAEVLFISVTSLEDLERWTPSLFALYEKRSRSVRRRGVWTNPRGRRFLEAWMRELALEGALEVTLLLADGVPEAFTFVIADADTHYLYGLAFDPESRFARDSPGEQLLVRAMESATKKGASWFDFLVGDEPYKRKWATESRKVTTRLLVPNAALRLLLKAWFSGRQRVRSYLARGHG